MLARVITVSDRSAAGLRPDLSGPILESELRTAGYEVSGCVVPDGEASVAAALRQALAERAVFIVTTGGTGVSPTDRTPEGTLAVVDRVLPGVAELIRSRGAAAAVHACLSRGVAGVVDAAPDHPGAFVVNLPGSPKAVAEGIAAVLPLVDHVVQQLAGGDH